MVSTWRYTSFKNLRLSRPRSPVTLLVVGSVIFLLWNVISQDYYESNAAKHFLAGIVRPALVLHALDNPRISAASYIAINWSRLPMIEAVLTPRGGHLGFHGRGSRVPWHDRVTAWWLAQRFQASTN